MYKKSSLHLLAAVILASLCGCITHKETVYESPERAKVEFENDSAARVFFEAFSKVHSKAEKNDSSTTLRIPVVFEYESRVVRGDNVAFNEAVRDCDTNQDGKITEQEARIYAERIEKGSK